MVQNHVLVPTSTARAGEATGLEQDLEDLAVMGAQEVDMASQENSEVNRACQPNETEVVCTKAVQAAQQLKLMMEKEGVAIPDRFWQANFMENETSLYYRFVVSRDLDMKKSKELLVNDIKWREEIDMVGFQALTLEEVTGCPREVFDQHYWSQLLGYDEADNFSPVVYRSIRGMRTGELMKHTTVQKMVNHQLWEFEHHCLYLFTHPQTLPPRKFKYIIDIKDMTWSQLTTDLLAILSGFSTVSQEHHPERLKTLYIIHAPRLFSMAWSLITPFVPQVTRDKISILSTGQLAKHPFLSVWLPHVDEAQANHFDPGNHRPSDVQSSSHPLASAHLDLSSRESKGTATTPRKWW